MAADSEENSQWRVEWEARLRKDFQEDPAMWLDKRYRWTVEKIEEQTEQTKSFVQNAAETLTRNLMQTRDSLILWLGIVVIVALASARLWIGVGGVGLIVTWVWFRNRLTWNMLDRLDGFRQRFQQLLDETERSGMLAEDKEFLRKHADSILYPLAVAVQRTCWYMPWDTNARCSIRGREEVRTDDLEHVETLYLEYRSGFAHLHRWPDLADPKSDTALQCELCMAARRVRAHIEGVFSKIEGAIREGREELVARIDGNNPEGAILTREFQEDFCKWWVPLEAGTELRTLFEWLRGKERWTFDQADKVLEACRMKTGMSSDEDAARIYDKLSREMGAAATQCGLWDRWKLYNQGRDYLVATEEVDKRIRRILGRHNPEAMFRELCYPDGSVKGDISELGTALKSWGLDGGMVERDIRAAWNFMGKKDNVDEHRERELTAAKASLWLEEETQKKHAKEATVSFWEVARNLVAWAPVVIVVLYVYWTWKPAPLTVSASAFPYYVLMAIAVVLIAGWAFHKLLKKGLDLDLVREFWPLLRP